MAPMLPARKAGGKRTPGPVKSANAQEPQSQTITLEDGTEVPVQIPPGMPPQQAEVLIEYLKLNPEAAKLAYEQAKTIIKTPGMANAFLNMQQNAQNATPEQMQRFGLLADDPDLKEMFDDIKANGANAFKKYWDDAELMSKVSTKLRALEMADKEGSESPTTTPAKPEAAQTLHGAAKQGNVEMVAKLLDEGKDVNELNEKAVSVLGVAVGFNRIEVVRLLLERGVDVSLQDGAGNTVLHYAAGYGRKEAAELLLGAGADMDATNKAGQKPLDVAKLNHEKQMVQFLKEQWTAKRRAARAAAHPEDE